MTRDGCFAFGGKDVGESVRERERERGCVCGKGVLRVSLALGVLTYRYSYTYLRYLIEIYILDHGCAHALALDMVSLSNRLSRIGEKERWAHQSTGFSYLSASLASRLVSTAGLRPTSYPQYSIRDIPTGWKRNCH